MAEPAAQESFKQGLVTRYGDVMLSGISIEGSTAGWVHFPAHMLAPECIAEVTALLHATGWTPTHMTNLTGQGHVLWFVKRGGLFDEE